MQEIKTIAQKIRNKQSLTEQERLIANDIVTIVQTAFQPLSLIEDDHQKRHENIALQLMFSVTGNNGHKPPAATA